jgi:hypothetical protein
LDHRNGIRKGENELQKPLDLRPIYIRRLAKPGVMNSRGC